MCHVKRLICSSETSENCSLSSAEAFGVFDLTVKFLRPEIWLSWLTLTTLTKSQQAAVLTKNCMLPSQHQKPDGQS